MTAIAMIEYGALPAVRLTAADGAQATVTLYGGHVISWRSADGAERLFCSARSALDGSRAIRGGIPVIFPQFAERGDGMRHGFARVNTWRLVDSGQADGAAFGVFALATADLAPAHAAAWPHGVALALRVSVRGGALDLSLEVRNTGASTFAFSSALHTYFAVDDLAQVSIGGVQEGELRIADKLDRIYDGIAAPITLADGAGRLLLEQRHFDSAVVWNPGALDAAALADMEDEEYRRFVCIEPAQVNPVTLAPGQEWVGTHRVSVQ